MIGIEINTSGWDKKRNNDNIYGLPIRPVYPLPKRIFQTLHLVAKGFNNAEIAREIQISEKTVENHVYPILSILQVRNRIEAIITAFQNGGMDTPASKKETDTPYPLWNSLRRHPFLKNKIDTYIRLYLYPQCYNRGDKDE